MKILAIFAVILIIGVSVYISNESDLNIGDQVYSTDLPDIKDGIVSTADAYKITDSDGLVKLSSLNTSSSKFSGKTIYLANDIDLSGINLTPIGTNAKLFNGTFDGQNHIISNLSITGSIQYAGLFGCIGSSGIVRNVALVDSSINVSHSSRLYVGGIAGIIGGTIENCYNTGTIVATGSSVAAAFAGGIAGYSEMGTIQNCYNSGTITVSTKSAASYAGGIVGANYLGRATVTNCYNTGDIGASASSLLFSSYAGGIAGGQLTTDSGTRGTISNCYNTGDLVSGDRLYGITSSGTVKNCYMLQTDNKGTTVTSDELKSAEILTALGDAYTADTSLINDGYPILTWQITSYTLSFDSQGGSTVEPQTINNGEVAIKPSDPAKDSKIFWYWALNDEVFDFSTLINSDLTLLAVWYDILFFTSMPGGII